MLRAFLAAAASLSLTAPAAAQDGAGIDGLAVELAYDYCPLYIDDEIKLESPEIAATGLIGPAKNMTHPRFGELEVLELERPDGTITFGGGKDSAFCQVLVGGPNSATALEKLMGNMTLLELDLERDAANSFTRDDALTVETFRAEMQEDVVAFVQFIRVDGPMAQTAIFQIAIMEE